MAIVAVKSLIGTYPQVAATICQQARYRIAAQAVVDAQCLESILSCCHQGDAERQKNENTSILQFFNFSILLPVAKIQLFSEF
jgi:hypothetical protein